MVFLIIGIAMAWMLPIASSFRTTAVFWLAGALGVTVAFFCFQRLRVGSLTAAWLSRQPLLQRLGNALHLVQDMEERLIQFYTQHRAKFAAALMFAFANWMAGVLEVYVMMKFLGQPISWTEAWVIESVIQLVRTASFFIPANLGTQEGAFVFAFSIITGSPALGLAAAVIRRLREVIWLSIAALVGLSFTRNVPLREMIGKTENHTK